MLTLIFELKKAYGHNRYYPANVAASAVVAVTGTRICLREHEMRILAQAGYIIRLRDETGKEVTYAP